MFKKFLAILFIICLAIPVMAKKRQSEEVITPLVKLEKRQFQTRDFDKADKEIVMKAVLNVLQDEGYIVYSANSLLGFIYGTKDFDMSDSDIDISKEFGLTKSRLNWNGVQVTTMEANANITDFSKVVKLRISFKRKLLNMYGNAQFIEEVKEEEYYQDFFSKVEKAVFLLKQEI